MSRAATQRRAASVRKDPSSEQKLRARVFCLCKELGIPDDARRILAGTYRADGKETMSGMRTGELYEMVNELERRDLFRTDELRKVTAAERAEKLLQHKRVEGPDSAWASERARHFLRQRAEEYYGPEWPQRLGIFLGGLWLKWEKRCQKNGQATLRPRGCMTVQTTPPTPPAKAGGNETPASRGELLFVPWTSETLPRNFHHWATEAMLAMIKREVGRK